jgi:hypothetical protein
MTCARAAGRRGDARCRDIGRSIKKAARPTFAILDRCTSKS